QISGRPTMRSGFFGNIQGAANATPTMTITSTRPTSAARLRAKRRAKSVARLSMRLPQPDPRIEPQIENIDGGVGDRHQQRAEHEHAEHHRKVPAHDAVEQQTADAGRSEEHTSELQSRPH